MPLYDLICLACQQEVPDRFFHRKPAPNAMPVCPQCGHRLTVNPRTSLGRGLTYFSEKSPQVIHNLGHDPVTITSEAQRQRIMKERGLTEAGRPYGRKGCWV